MVLCAVRPGAQGVTIPEAARALGLLERQVRRWAVRLGYVKAGRDWHLTPAQVERIRRAARR